MTSSGIFVVLCNTEEIPLEAMVSMLLRLHFHTNTSQEKLAGTSAHPVVS